MDALCEKLQKCKECRFSDWEINIWNEEKGFGKYGCFAYSENAKIMIIGQNPSNRRFPAPLNHSMGGHQGDLFREIFGKENLILTNLVRISTPDNKITIEDALHGYVHLKEEIDFYKPSLILALGKFCRNVIPLKSNITYLKHPDYFMTYRVRDLDKYVETIKDIKKNYDEKIKTLI